MYPSKPLLFFLQQASRGAANLVRQALLSAYLLEVDTPQLNERAQSDRQGRTGTLRQSAPDAIVVTPLLVFGQGREKLRFGGRKP